MVDSYLIKSAEKNIDVYIYTLCVCFAESRISLAEEWGGFPRGPGGLWLTLKAGTRQMRRLQTAERQPSRVRCHVAR